MSVTSPLRLHARGLWRIVLSVPLMTRHDLRVVTEKPLLRRAGTFTEKSEEAP